MLVLASTYRRAGSFSSLSCRPAALAEFVQAHSVNLGEPCPHWHDRQVLDQEQELERDLDHDMSSATML